MSLVVGRTLAHSSAPVAALSANLAAGCVGLFAPLATVITSLGLDWLHWWDVQQPILYGASVLAVEGRGSGRLGAPARATMTLLHVAPVSERYGGVTSIDASLAVRRRDGP